MAPETAQWAHHMLREQEDGSPKPTLNTGCGSMCLFTSALDVRTEKAAGGLAGQLF